jgi:hypothetical protein
MLSSESYSCIIIFWSKLNGMFNLKRSVDPDIVILILGLKMKSKEEKNR